MVRFFQMKGVVMETRRAMFAGSWYPGTASECEREIQQFLKEGLSAQVDKPVGGIVPHAGWMFSGSIACNVINNMKNGGSPDTIVIFGKHMRPSAPLTILAEGAWETPFGDIEIDDKLANELIPLHRFSVETPGAGTPDNTIELQLPFIKYFFPEARIVPIGAPPNEIAAAVGKSAAQISRDLDIRLKTVGSTDLTHYGVNYGFMPRGTGPDAVEWVKNENDKRVVDAMLQMDESRVVQEGLENQNACCPGAAAAAIALGKTMGSKQGHLLKYATSYDVNPGSSFVGYAGIVF
jgi:hypothetical protein